MEEMEQPSELGSNEYGKFKDAESLLKAYNNLEAEFTKKSQRLASLEQENEIREKSESRRNQIEKKVDDFVTKFDAVKPFTNTLKENLTKDENLSIEELAISLLSNNYKAPTDYIKDEEFLNNYIYNNQEIADKIIKDYLTKLTQDSPIKVEGSMRSISLTPPSVPTTIEEAGRLAKNIIKQK